MITSQCEQCGKEIVRAGFTPGRFCSRECAGEHRRTWKPVDRDWLHQKYVVEGLGTTQIGRLVGRHPKRVYGWLRDFGIPMREKWRGNVPPRQPFHDPEWLKAEYGRGRNCYSIAEECGVAPATVHRYLVRFGIETRTAVESTKLAGKQTGFTSHKNPMRGRKGPLATNWKGGITPERQAFYESPEWASACSSVWKRDDATCRRCHTRKSGEDQTFCIHHVVSFAIKHLRAEPSNLILLCEECHRWVHSNANANREFIRNYEADSDPPSG
jgi:5-methylcytosine-specific restriction endonuclease McrA